MARYFKKRRLFRSRRMINRRRRKAIKSLLKSKKLIKKYSLPTKVKLIGMSEKKHLIIRTVQKYSVGMSPDANNEKFVYQILLDPLSSPDITKVTEDLNIGGVGVTYFSYDYMRVRSIVIVIRPVMGLPSTNITTIANPGAQDMQQEPSTPIYGYYTLKLPLLLNNDNGAAVDRAFSIQPEYNRLKLEGSNKSTFSFPSTQSVSLVLNSLKTRITENDAFVFSNKLIALQYISRSNTSANNFFNPFERAYRRCKTNELNSEDSDDGNINETRFKDSEEREDNNNFYATNTGNIDVPSIDVQSSLLNFGRIVLVSEKNYKFTAEIIYDCDFYR